MNNAASRQLYEETPADQISLAPVIPITSVKEEKKKTNAQAVKAGSKQPVPHFTEPVFKPKKHNMLL
jgi:hypothetical protein